MPIAAQMTFRRRQPRALSAVPGVPIKRHRAVYCESLLVPDSEELDDRPAEGAHLSPPARPASALATDRKPAIAAAAAATTAKTAATTTKTAATPSTARIRSMRGPDASRDIEAPATTRPISAGNFTYRHRVVVPPATPAPPTSTDVDPKVCAEYASRPGTLPRRVRVERLRRKYESGKLEDLLMERGVNYADPNFDKERCLPLEPFDDTEYDVRTPEEWMSLAQSVNGGSPLPLSAQVLCLADPEEQNYGTWRKSRIHSFDPLTRTFSFTWADMDFEDEVVQTTTRLQLLFDREDPVAYADRLAKAHLDRRNAEALVRYNFFIDNMPTDGVQQLTEEQAERLVESVDVSNYETSLIESALHEVQLDFARTMNKLTFDTQLIKRPNDTLVRLSGLSHFQPSGPVPDLLRGIRPPVAKRGLCRIPDHAFAETFATFCFSTLRVRHEVIQALQGIQAASLQVAMKERVFSLVFERPVRLDELRQRQRAAMTTASMQIKRGWMTQLQEIVYNAFAGIGKGWFNIQETSQDLYKRGKLRRFLNLARFLMQTTLRNIAEYSIQDIIRTFEKADPAEIFCDKLSTAYCKYKDWALAEVGAATSTHRTSYQDLDAAASGPAWMTAAAAAAMAAGGPSAQLVPLFHMDAVRQEPTANAQGESFRPTSSATPAPEASNQHDITFSVDPSRFVTTLVEAFDVGLDSLNEVQSLERLLVPQLAKIQTDSQFILAFDPSDKWIETARDKLKAIAERSLPYVSQCLQLLREHCPLLNRDPASHVEAFVEVPHVPVSDDEIKQAILREQQLEEELLENLPDSVTVGLFEISCRDLRRQLAQKHSAVVDLLLELLVKRLRSQMSDTLLSFQSIASQLQKLPRTVEELVEMKRFAVGVPRQVEVAKTEIESDIKLYEVIESFRVKLSLEDAHRRWHLAAAPKLALDETAKKLKVLQDCESDFARQLQVQQTDFSGNLDDFEQTVELFRYQATYRDLNRLDEIVDIVENVNARLAAAAEQAALLNSREALLNRAVMDYSRLQDCATAFSSFSDLWLTARMWYKHRSAWRSGPLQEIDAQFLKKEIALGLQRLSRVCDAFHQDPDLNPAVIKIANDTNRELKEFLPNVPIVIALCTEGMEEWHWREISEMVGTEISPDMSKFTLRNLCSEKFRIQDHVEGLQDIAERASKEYGIEKQLRALKAEWEHVQLDCAHQYRNTNTYILEGTEGVAALLDEQLSAAQVLQYSPFRGGLAKEIDEWVVQLRYMLEHLEEWKKCQASWVHLQPIFDSVAVVRQLPSEARRFKTNDSLWRNIMKATHESPKALDSLSDTTRLVRWTQANEAFELVKKGLDDYLAAKRKGFPRFYLLSNDELTQIISHLKEPEAVEALLPCVFQGLRKLSVEQNDGSEKAVTSVILTHGEELTLQKVVEIRDTSEDSLWLEHLETSLFRTIRSTLRSCVSQFPTDGSTVEWVLENPLQFVIAAERVHFTFEVEDCLVIPNCILSMKANFQETIERLDIFSKRIRAGNLGATQSQALSTVVLLIAQQRDLWLEFAKAGVSGLHNFAWQSKLRFCWEEDESVSSKADLWVTCLHGTIPYAHECLRVRGTLVATPLTERCTLALLSSFYIHSGTALTGPAGTGKTELVREVASAVGTICLLSSSAYTVDRTSLLRFLLGAASGGYWCCIEEVGSLSLELVSVLLQQLSEIFVAKHSGLVGGGDPSDVFARPQPSTAGTVATMTTRQTLAGSLGIRASFTAGTQVQSGGAPLVQPGFHVVLTTCHPHPSSLGQRLPESLRTLFRPCSMVGFDSFVLVEGLLLANGFTQAAAVSSKISILCRLIDESLPSLLTPCQKNGRLLRSVVEAAAATRKAEVTVQGNAYTAREQMQNAGLLPAAGDTSAEAAEWLADLELRALAQALIDGLAGGLPREERKILEAVVRDVFPSSSVSADSVSSLQQEIERGFRSQNLLPLPSLVTKVAQLNALAGSRSSLMLLGPSGAGKSCCLEVLRSVAAQVAEAPSSAAISMACRPAFSLHTINPRSIGLGELFGELDVSSHEWRDGLLPTAIRTASNPPVRQTGRRPDKEKDKDKDKEKELAPWIRLDGSLDGQWIDGLTPALGDARMLPLASGERLYLGDKVRIIFETDSLAAASPSAVAAVGLLHFDPSDLPAAALLQALLSQLPPNCTALAAQTEQLCRTVVLPAISFARKSGLLESTLVNDALLCGNFVKLLMELLKQGGLELASAAQKTAVEPTRNWTDQAKAASMAAHLDQLLIFSLVWSVGALLDRAPRLQFCEEVTRLALQADLHTGSIPPNLELCDCYYSVQTSGWLPWLHLTNAAEGAGGHNINNNSNSNNNNSNNTSSNNNNNNSNSLHAAASPTADARSASKLSSGSPNFGGGMLSFGLGPGPSVLVPTSELLSASGIMQQLLPSDRHVMLMGPREVGKSSSVQHWVSQFQARRQGETTTLNYSRVALSVGASGNTLRSSLDIHLERRRRGLYGPRRGGRCVFFIDDLHLPEVTRGQSPTVPSSPNEFLRQWLESGVWHRPPQGLCKVVDCVVVTAAGSPSTTGRAVLKDRVARHLHSLVLLPWEQHSFTRVMTTLLERSGALVATHSDAASRVHQLVSASSEILSKLQTNFSPTPARAHCTFGVRSFLRMLQGLCSLKRFDHSPPLLCLGRLWFHETSRCWGDGLPDAEDRVWLSEQLLECSTQISGQPKEMVLMKDGLFFQHAVGRTDYHEVADTATFKATVSRQAQELADQTGYGQPLVMFKEACNHLARVRRLLGFAGGHAMLLSVGPTGRKSLSKLAAYSLGLRPAELPGQTGATGISPLQQSALRDLVMGAGIEGTPVMLYLSESDVTSEPLLAAVLPLLEAQFLTEEGISSEDLESITKVCTARCHEYKIEPTRENIFSVFRKAIHDDFHVVFSMRPGTAEFRRRLRVFPSLLASCGTDWFDPWPDTALLTCAERYFGDLSWASEALPALPESKPTTSIRKGPHLLTDGEEGVLRACPPLAGALSGIYKSARDFAEGAGKLGRWAKTTLPTAFLEMLQCFRAFVTDQLAMNRTKHHNLHEAVAKLAASTQHVKMVEADLMAMRPQVEALRTTVQMKVAELEKARTKSAAERSHSKGVAAGTQAGASPAALEEYGGKVDQSKHRLGGASLEELGELQQAALALARQEPPPPSLPTFPDLCVEGLRLAGRIVGDQQQNADGEILEHPTHQFLSSILAIDRDRELPWGIQHKLEEIARPDSALKSQIESESPAGFAVIVFLGALCDYQELKRTGRVQNKEVEANSMNDVYRIEVELARALSKEQEMVQEISQIEAKLSRSQLLLATLQTRKDGWVLRDGDMNGKSSLLIGNMLMAASIVTHGLYLGDEERHQFKAQVQESLKKNNILFSASNITLQSLLNNPGYAREWHSAGLPEDAYLTEAALGMQTLSTCPCARWPLLLDPHSQGATFVKALSRWNDNNPEGKGVDILRPRSARFSLALRAAVETGRPVLVPGVESGPHATLLPLLERGEGQTASSSSSEEESSGSPPPTTISIGEGPPVLYNPGFRLYMTALSLDDSWAPDSLARVNVINFEITKKGLERYFMAFVLARDKPDLERRRAEVHKLTLQLREEITKQEDQLLEMLSTAQGYIVDDPLLVGSLVTAAEALTTHSARLPDLEQKDRDIVKEQRQYRPLAKAATGLFEALQKLSLVSSLYCYSLQFFVELLSNVLADFKAQMKERLAATEKALVRRTFVEIGQTMEDRHRLVWGLQLCLGVLSAPTPPPSSAAAVFAAISAFGAMGGGSMVAGPNDPVEDPEKGAAAAAAAAAAATAATPAVVRVAREEELQFLATPESEYPDASEMPELLEVSFLSYHQKGAVAVLNNVLSFSGLIASFSNTEVSDNWKYYIATAAPETERLPGHWEHMLEGALPRLCVVKALRPDRLLDAAIHVIHRNLGMKPDEIPRPSLPLILQNTSHTTPVLLISAGGRGPATEVRELARSLHIEKTLDQACVGPGQSARVRQLLATSGSSGGWVLLTDIHRDAQSLLCLQDFCDSFGTTAMQLHREFRLWLTCAPSDTVPPTLLKFSRKYAYAAPTGMKAQLLDLYNSMPEDDLMSEVHPRFSLALAVLHVHASERPLFQSLGFCKPFSVIAGDFEAARRSLQALVRNWQHLLDGRNENTSDVPVVALASSATSAGKLAIPGEDITLFAAMLGYSSAAASAQDSQLLQFLAKKSILFAFAEAPLDQSLTLQVNERSSPSNGGVGNTDGSEVLSGLASTSNKAEFMQCLGQINFPESLSDLSHAGHFVKSREVGYQMLSTLDSLMRPEMSATDSEEVPDIDSLAERLDTIRDHFPAELLETVRKSRSTPAQQGSKGMDGVLVREAAYLADVIAKIKDQVRLLSDALQGSSELGNEAEDVAASILREEVPSCWGAIGLPPTTCLSLSVWVSHVAERSQFWASWVASGRPKSLWLAAFAFPKALCTTICRRHAVKLRAPVEAIKLHYEVRAMADLEDVESLPPPSDGCHVHGLYLEGCSWDHRAHSLAHLTGKETLTPLPVIWFRPKAQRETLQTGVFAQASQRSGFAPTCYRTRSQTLLNLHVSTRSPLDLPKPLEEGSLLDLELPTKVDPEAWVLGGVKLLLSPL